MSIKDDGVHALHLNADIPGDGITQGAGGVLEADPDGTSLEISGGKIAIVAGREEERSNE